MGDRAMQDRAERVRRAFLQEELGCSRRMEPILCSARPEYVIHACRVEFEGQRCAFLFVNTEHYYLVFDSAEAVALDGDGQPDLPAEVASACAGWLKKRNAAT
jgi:hypothetical protein